MAVARTFSTARPDPFTARPRKKCPSSRFAPVREQCAAEYPTPRVGFNLGEMAGNATPKVRPIDPRGPRFNQAVLTIALLTAFLLDAKAVVPVFAVVLFLGAAFGPRYGPFLRLYADVIRPRLEPPAGLAGPRPPRFAAAVGVGFLGAATAAFAAGAGTPGWALALVVAALAGLAATTGICVGCEVYLFRARRRGVELVA